MSLKMPFAKSTILALTVLEKAFVKFFLEINNNSLIVLQKLIFQKIHDFNSESPSEYIFKKIKFILKIKTFPRFSF